MSAPSESTIIATINDIAWELAEAGGVITSDDTAAVLLGSAGVVPSDAHVAQLRRRVAVERARRGQWGTR